MRRSTSTISKEDLIQISLLLHKGYSLSSSLMILGRYEEIEKQLEQGNDFQQFIDFHSKDPFYTSLRFFMEISSLDQAILSAYEYHKVKKQMRENWLKETTYPLFVLFFSFMVFIFFEIQIYPQLSMMIDAQKGFQLHQLLYFILSIVVALFVIGSFLLIFLLIMKKCKKEKYQQFYLNYLGNFFLIKKIISYDFALHALILMKRGYSTKQILESLTKLKNNTFLQINIQDMMLKLKQGEEMLRVIENQSYLDPTFKQFFKMGYYTQNLENILNDYCEFQRNEFKKLLKISSKIVSGMAYMLIAILVISIYQLLLLPLDMIHQM